MRTIPRVNGTVAGAKGTRRRQRFPACERRPGRNNAHGLAARSRSSRAARLPVGASTSWRSRRFSGSILACPIRLAKRMPTMNRSTMLADSPQDKGRGENAHRRRTPRPPQLKCPWCLALGKRRAQGLTTACSLQARRATQVCHRGARDAVLRMAYRSVLGVNDVSRAYHRQPHT